RSRDPAPVARGSRGRESDRRHCHARPDGCVTCRARCLPGRWAPGRGAPPAERRGGRRADGMPRRLGRPGAGATCCRERLLRRVRGGGLVAAFVVLRVGATVVIACGGLMESGIRNTVPPQRLAAPPFVVTGSQNYRDATLPERARLDSRLIARLWALPGVAKV